jgi:uncharacterized protein YoxC
MISSIGFVVLGIGMLVLLVYLIRISRSFDRIITRAEKDIDELGDTTKEMLEEIKDSTLFHMFFKRRSKRISKRD